MMGLVLSLFPGIGLFDMAFEQEGFCVVRGPDVLWGGDIRRFHPPAGRFNGVIGGPPCQAHSIFRRLAEHQSRKVAEDLIPEFCRCAAEAAPQWFVMENVPAAPDPRVEGYAVHGFALNNRWLGEPQNRLRKFWFAVRGEKIACESSGSRSGAKNPLTCATTSNWQRLSTRSGATRCSPARASTPRCKVNAAGSSANTTAIPVGRR